MSNWNARARNRKSTILPSCGWSQFNWIVDKDKRVSNVFVWLRPEDSDKEFFDVKALATLCRERGILLAVDAAQAAGAIPVDLHDLGVDYYAFPGQKWLMGPSGTGGRG